MPLRWVSDCDPGLRRLRAAKGFRYVDDQGRPVRDEGTLRRIRALYDIEDDIRGKAPAVRKAQRQARAGPLLKELREWLEALLVSGTLLDGH